PPPPSDTKICTSRPEGTAGRSGKGSGGGAGTAGPGPQTKTPYGNAFPEGVCRGARNRTRTDDLFLAMENRVFPLLSPRFPPSIPTHGKPLYDGFSEHFG